MAHPCLGSGSSSLSRSFLFTDFNVNHFIGASTEQDGISSAPIGLGAPHAWYMPHEVPRVFNTPPPSLPRFSKTTWSGLPTLLAKCRWRTPGFDRKVSLPRSLVPACCHSDLSKVD